jgi:hypothetical protein
MFISGAGSGGDSLQYNYSSLNKPYHQVICPGFTLKSLFVYLPVKSNDYKGHNDFV